MPRVVRMAIADAQNSTKETAPSTRSRARKLTVIRRLIQVSPPSAKAIASPADDHRNISSQGRIASPAATKAAVERLAKPSSKASARASDRKRARRSGEARQYSKPARARSPARLSGARTAMDRAIRSWTWAISPCNRFSSTVRSPRLRWYTATSPPSRRAMSSSLLAD